MHIPVLKKEVIEYLNPESNENFIDATIDGGGHTAAILKKNEPNGKVLGIELDPELYKNLLATEIKNQKSKIKNRLILVNDSYINLKEIIKKYNFKPINGILFDLGMSSWHLEKSGRGFSFLRNEPLIMRYQLEEVRPPKNSRGRTSLTAEKIVNEWPEDTLERILKDYGEERFSKKIAREIIRERKKRPIKTTLELVKVIKRAVPFLYEHYRIHPATRTFQALRIVVNDELNNLRIALPQALEILEENGRLVIISFHSLEDKIVKDFFKEKAKENKIKILFKKPIRPTLEEIKINPSSRSAKLRTAIKTTRICKV